MEIKDSYNGVNVRNISFTKKYGDGVILNFGKYRCSTQDKGILAPSNEEEYGVHIFQDENNKNKGLRIHRDYGLAILYPPACLHDDHILVHELVERQNNVLLTDFPTGIVTINDCVVGQEISFYDEYKELYKLMFENKDILLYLRKVIQIIKELEENGILYKDIHPKNFLYKGEDVKLIDFDQTFIYFDERRESSFYSDMISNLKSMLSLLTNNKLEMDKCRFLDDIEDYLGNLNTVSKKK